MAQDKLAAAQQREERLMRELLLARSEREQLEKRREQYENTVTPVVESARETVSESVASLQEWRQRFNEAVDNFDTESLGELGRELVQIERPLFNALHRVVSTAHDAKMTELEMQVAPDNGVEIVQHVDPAVRDALRDAGGGDSRLAVFDDVSTETGQRFREMLLSYLSDQRVKLYHPRGGLDQFRR